MPKWAFPSGRRAADSIVKGRAQSSFSTEGSWPSVICGLLLPGCRDAEKPKTGDLPEWIEASPYDTKLSDIPGVSIVQVMPSLTE